MRSADTKHVDPGDTAQVNVCGSGSSPLDPFVVLRLGSGESSVGFYFDEAALPALRSLIDGAMEAERDLLALVAAKAKAAA